MPKQLFDVLGKFKDNSLLYLCITCKPKKYLLQTESKISDIESLLGSMSKDNKRTTAYYQNKLEEVIEKVDSLNLKLESDAHRHDEIKQLLDKTPPSQDVCTKDILHNLDSLKNMVKELTPGTGSSNPTVNEKLEPTKPTWASTASALQELSAFVSRGPSAQDIDPECYDSGLVVYNVPSMIRDIDAVHHLASVCYIDKRNIIASKRLKSGRKCPPLLIQCANKNVKWSFIKALNASKAEDTYARPHLTPSEMQKDKDLVRKLNDLRKLYPEHLLKIYKGNIVEEVEGYYIPFDKNTTPSPCK